MNNLTFFSNLNRRPARAFSDVERDFERLFDFYAPAQAEAGSWPRAERSFSPSVDLLDRDTHYVMNFDIPGVHKDDVKIEVNDGVLNVEGERKFEHREGDYVERSYGHFKRMAKLPEGVEQDNVEARFENGVLSIAIPKAKTSRRKEIEIQDGQKSGVWDTLLGVGQNKSEAIEQDKKKAGTKLS